MAYVSNKADSNNAGGQYKGPKASAWVNLYATNKDGVRFKWGAVPITAAPEDGDGSTVNTLLAWLQESPENIKTLLKATTAEFTDVSVAKAPIKMEF